MNQKHTQKVTVPLLIHSTRHCRQKGGGSGGGLEKEERSKQTLRNYCELLDGRGREDEAGGWQLTVTGETIIGLNSLVQRQRLSVFIVDTSSVSRRRVESLQLARQGCGCVFEGRRTGRRRRDWRRVYICLHVCVNLILEGRTEMIRAR